MKFPNFLRIAIVTNMDLFMVNVTEEKQVQITGGLESNFVKILAEGLSFRYSVRIPEDGEWGRLTNDGKWTGVIGLVSENETDIGVSKLGISFEKLSAVDFTYPYNIERVTFATAPPGLLSKETAVIRPFSFEVWIALAVSTVLITAAFKFILKYNYKLQYLFLEVAGCFVLQSKGIKAEKLSERFVVSAWILSAMLLSYSYTAVLLSFLTVPLREQPINNKHRLLEAIEKKNYKCFTPAGSFVLKTLIRSGEKTLEEIANHIEKNNWLIEPSKEALADIFNKNKIAVINPRNHFRILPRNKALVSKDSFFLLYWGIAVNKNFCCKKALDLMVHRIVASGLYQKAEEDFYFQSQLKYSKFLHDGSTSKHALELRDVISAFLFLISGYILACIALVVEIVIRKKNKK